MLLTNRRHRLIFAALAALDVAGLLPWLTLLADWWARGGDPLSLRAAGFLLGAPLAVFILLWIVQLAFVLAADLVNRYAIATPLREVIIFLLIGGTALTAVRMILYPAAPLGDLSWLRQTFSAVFDFTESLRGELLVILLAFFLWWRVARYTDHGVTFFSIARTFRLGLLLSLIANGALAQHLPNGLQPAALYFSLYMAFGLMTVALARIDQKAAGAANSSGALMPWPRFAQLLIAVAALLGGGWLAAAALTPASLRAVLSWFGPLGTLIQWLVIQLVFLFFWAFGPILEALAAYLYGIMGEIPPQEGFEMEPPDPVTVTTLVREWTLLRYCLVAGAIVLVLGLIWLFFMRTRLYNRRSEEEETASEEAALQLGRAGFNLDRLRNWLKMVGRYGVGRRLLAAISVENMYANLVRLARQRGITRPPALPPERFLPMLNQAFPGCELELDTLTRAYLRVRYGEHPADPRELAQIRAAYTRILQQANDTPSDAEQTTR